MNITLTDEQLANAIEQKLERWLDLSFKKTQDVWIHKHVCTVLDHASKIIRADIDNINQEMFRQDA